MKEKTIRNFKDTLWLVLFISYGIWYTEGLAWGPNETIRVRAGIVHYAMMISLYLFYFIQGILVRRANLKRLVCFLFVYHVFNVPLFVIGWYAFGTLLFIFDVSSTTMGDY